MNSYRPFFGFAKEPFSHDLDIKDIMNTPELQAVCSRFQYALALGGVAVITGEIGSGKSTAMRFAQHELHPAEFLPLHLFATSGSILELYRQIAHCLGLNQLSASKARMTALIRAEIQNLRTVKKLKPLLIIDEASLLRVDVCAELHTLLQFQQDAKHYLPLFLVGQANILDKLAYRHCAPLASRVITRCHLEGLNLQDMQAYLLHHIKVAGVNHPLFDDSATVAIHQGAGGLLRKANHLARGALIAAAKHNAHIVCADHVRLAATEIL